MKDEITYKCGCWYSFEWDHGEFLVVEECGTQFGLCEKHWKMVDDND